MFNRLNEYIESLQKEYNSKMDDMQSMLADKESLNRALTDSCNDLKAKVDVMAAEHEEVAILRKNVADITAERNLLKQSIAETEKSLNRASTEHEKTIERVKAEAQIAKDKAVLEVESKYREQIQNLKEQKQAEIDKYQQKYLELLEQMKALNN